MHLGNCTKVRCKSGTHIDRLSRQWVKPGVESGGTPGVKDNRRSGNGRPKFQSTHSTSGHDGCGASMGQPMMNQMSSVSGPMTLRQSGSTGRPCTVSSKARQPAKPWRISAPQVDALCRAAPSPPCTSTKPRRLCGEPGVVRRRSRLPVRDATWS